MSLGFWGRYKREDDPRTIAKSKTLEEKSVNRGKGN